MPEQAKPKRKRYPDKPKPFTVQLTWQGYLAFNFVRGFPGYAGLNDSAIIERLLTDKAED